MNEQKILSIVIPTFNRKDSLKELIGQILTSDRQDFLIEVTDNASTDGTIDMLESINDDRIRVYRNAENIGGIPNMVCSIFNCSSKYALFLNDRELFDPSGIGLLIDVLKKDEYSFVQVPSWEYANSEYMDHELRTFNKGLESLLYVKYRHHPSGMVFNANIIHDNLNQKIYLEWPGMEKYSILVCDVVMLEKSAFYNVKMWSERDRSYLKLNLSGSATIGKPEQCYFHFLSVFKDYRLTTNHLLVHRAVDAKFTESERGVIGLDIANFFFQILLSYKPAMWSKNNCIHYKIEPKFISTCKMLKIYNAYYVIVLEAFDKAKLPATVTNEWNKGRIKKKFIVIMSSLKYDIWHFIPEIVKKMIKKDYRIGSS